MLVNQTLTAFLGFLSVLPIHENLNNLLKMVSQNVFDEIDCVSVMMVNDEQEEEKHFPVSILMESFQQRPIYNYKNHRNWKPLKSVVNDNILIIVRLNACKSCNEKKLSTIWNVQKDWRTFFFMLFIDDIVDDSFIADLLQYCAKNKAIFTIALQGSAVEKNQYYTMRIYPEFSLRPKQFDWSLQAPNIYPKHKNLYGYPLRICALHWPPYSFKYEQNGVEELAGVYGAVINEFARYMNGTLTFPKMKFNRYKSFTKDALESLANDEFDICSFTQTIPENGQNIILTYPIDLSFSCVAVPFGKDVPHYKYFSMIIKKEVLIMLITVLFVSSILLHLNNIVHSRMKPFWEYFFDLNYIGLVLGLAVFMKRLISGKSAVQKIILILLALSGTIFNTSFIAFLQAFTTTNPKQPVIANVQQLIKSQLTIYIPEFDYYNIMNYETEYKFLLPYLTKFNGSSYIKFNKSLEGHAFISGSFDWRYHSQRMEILGYRTHVLSEICLLRNVAQKLPCARNSVFVKHLSRFIVYLGQTGLMDKWFWRDFSRLNGISSKEHKYQKKFEILEAEDLIVIFIILTYGLLTGTLVFIAELLWYRRKFFLQNIKFLGRVKQKVLNLNISLK